MKISPVNFVGYRKTSFVKTENSKQINDIYTKKQLSFKSIFADARPENERVYAMYTSLHPEFSILKSCSTRIFRELACELAISRMLDPNEKSEIKILGASDGSEAWAYAIALNEAMGDKAKENVKISGVDIAPYMVEVAKTGKIVCSDIERVYANNTSDAPGAKSPIKGDGWEKYLIKSDAPEGFELMKKKYPCLKYMELDPVAVKQIGMGLDWYEVNKENLPEVTFKQGDMMDNIKCDEQAKNIVYVIANSSAYILEKSPEKFVELFEKIKEENKGSGKKIYVVLGQVEYNIISPSGRIKGLLAQNTKDFVRRRIKQLGFEKLPEKKYRKLGIVQEKEASEKIYQLK